MPFEVCLQGAIDRIGKKRYELPWLETELDEEFKKQIEEFSEKNLPCIYSLIEKYKNGKRIVIFKSREQADAFLNGETND